MRVSTTLPCLYEVWWSVYGSLVSLVITPRDHCINLRKFRVLYIPIPFDSFDWFPHCTTSNWEGMSSSILVFVGLVLDWGMNPQPCKFQEVHGFNSINWITDSWKWISEDTNLNTINADPVWQLTHRSGSVKIMMFDDDQIGLFKICNFQSQSFWEFTFWWIKVWKLSKIVYPFFLGIGRNIVGFPESCFGRVLLDISL